MKKHIKYLFYCEGLTILIFLLAACGKKDSSPAPPPPVKQVSIRSVLLNNTSFDNTLYGISPQASILIRFSEPLSAASIPGAVSLSESGGIAVSINITRQNGDSALLVQPQSNLKYLNRYSFSIAASLKSASGGGLTNPFTRDFATRLDSSRKFPQLSDSALLDKVQLQTFRYFWDLGHPASGMARERNNSGDVVTSGGTGFGIMATLCAIKRGFITRTQGLTRIQTITSFLNNTAQKFHGAFPHWINGSTGAVIPFSTKDNGADLVETSFLMQGLLAARQYFDGSSPEESALRGTINLIWNGVEWDWFRQNNQDVLYWHWSPNYNWDMNFPIRGWNECLITYILAASSTTHTVPATIYSNGWAANGTNGFINGNSYYGVQLPLGPPSGGPLFFEHYSFLGINPDNLSDAYGSYANQTKNHTLINYNYCKANPKNFYGYSDSCWGLTASDIPNGYTASSPTNDVGVIAPTAAISSLPYTPTESMQALKFFYYVLGDKLWGDYGFKDAFNLQQLWFADSYLAIDQGPIVVMIENYRSGLIWQLMMSCPEVKAGLTKLGFTSPHI